MFVSQHVKTTLHLAPSLLANRTMNLTPPISMETPSSFKLSKLPTHKDMHCNQLILLTREVLTQRIGTQPCVCVCAVPTCLWVTTLNPTLCVAGACVKSLVVDKKGWGNTSFRITPLELQGTAFRLKRG